ncbi:MAG: hypothetical protein HFH86_04600 [Bacilli bacterium]|nr:hypothetical protein [Bacilli bacterium]
MMKYVSKILYGFLLLILIPSMVSAESLCPSGSYQVTYGGEVYIPHGLGYSISGQRDYNYQLRFYNTSSGGVNLKTYCMSPAKLGGAHLDVNSPRRPNYSCERVIDPSGLSSNGNITLQAYDVAITKAYQKLLADGRATMSNEDRIVGELVFRWLSYNYGLGDTGKAYERGADDVLKLFSEHNQDGTVKYWDVPLQDESGKNISYAADISYAKEVYKKAMEAGNEILAGKKYEDLVPSGPGQDTTLWGDTYTYVIDKVVKGDNMEEFTIHLDASHGEAPSHIFWNKFVGGCKNSTVKCTSRAEGSGKTGKVVITVERMNNYDGKTYELYFDSSYYDVKASGSNIMLLNVPTNASMQKMLVVADGNMSIQSAPPSRQRHHVYADGCEEQPDGTFDYVTYKDGKETSRKEELTVEEQIRYNCPNTGNKIYTKCVTSSGKPMLYTYSIETNAQIGTPYELTNEMDMVHYGCALMCKLFPDSTRNDNHYGWASENMWGKVTYGNSYYFNKTDFQTYCDNFGLECYYRENGDVYYGDQKLTTTDEMVAHKCPLYCSFVPKAEQTNDKYGWANQDDYKNGKYFYSKMEFEQKCGEGNKRTCEIINGVHYGKDGTEVDETQYLLECTPKYCRYENGNYYDAAGNITTKDNYYSETALGCCQVLDKNSEDYKRYCGGQSIDCGKDPDINFIGKCTEFNSNNDFLVNHVKDVKDDAQIKYCLFNAKNHDKAGNSFEMTDQDTVSNNPYCKVSCVENYEFKLPNSEYTMSGSYFELETKVSGTRTCYVNGREDFNGVKDSQFNGIDHVRFRYDLDQEFQKLIANYNEYVRYKTALSHIESETKTAVGHTESKTCADGYSECGCTSSGSCSATVWYVESYNYTSLSYSYDRNGQMHISSGISNQGADIVSSDGSASDGGCGASPTCTDGSKETVEGRVNAKISEYETAYKANLANINKIFKQYNDCSNGWSNEFAFDPSITFKYDEPYQNMSGFNNKFETGTIHVKNSASYCAGSVDNQYNCAQSTTDVAGEQAEQYINCNANGCYIETRNVSNAKYVSKTATVQNQVYRPNNKFSIYVPSGTIALDKSQDKYVLYTNLCDGSGACLPISLNQKTGVFNFDFTISHVGQFNDSNTPGRLIGTSNSVFNASKSTVTAGYVCFYVNNCPNCDVKCDPWPCEIVPDDDCPECISECPDCIFTQNNNFFYRTVSINNLMPNEREYGFNWQNVKGKYTQTKIEESAENIYETPEYSYVINPLQMKRIREYNKAVGGYLNVRMDDNNTDALVCESRVYENKSYANLVCRSNFLSEGNGKYFEEKARNTEWILWPNSGYFTNGTKYVVSDGLGPAWK